ncbi:MAG: hypothetical protein PWP28_1177 [Oceanotoga sp.]|jgi:cell division protein FtsB|uniref:Uncharacterized protein n=1 Tax=Oceanotoga teriensis TaxID=515440 RepID=A0AA45HHU5_9BACT|nr:MULTISPECIES: hypothetical protein [Oceanotoga]MDN5342302.1 hypothetical protein [Oceanotoga sp.]PWJ88755.1 hypothetical protein C7380_11745 [Oceanotoga teriensis]
MPFVTIKEVNKKNHKKVKKSKKVSIVFLFVLMTFFGFQIFRIVFYYKDLENQYNGIKAEQIKLEEIYKNKYEKYSLLKIKLEERGVLLNNGTILQNDIYNIPQTKERTN